MGKVESTLREEIMRLAKKEVRAVFRPLAREIRAIKLKLSSFSKNVSFLDRWAKEKMRQDEKDKLKLEATAEEVKASRFTPERIRNLRLKLGLSQKELAMLTGVTIGAVVAWEKGRFGPQRDKKAIIIAMRKLGRRDVKKVLEKKLEQVKKRKPVRRKVKKGKKKRRVKKKQSGRVKGRKR